MNLKRVFKPELSNNIEVSKLQRSARITGGYMLGLAGYGLGIAALVTAGPTAGLSVPAFGALSAASYAGSRALIRPAYQNDQEYAPVRDENSSQKIGRYALFGLGIIGFNTGANLITGGLFSAYESSIGVGYRIASVAGGYLAAKYGIRAVQSSFDPKLYSDEAIDSTRQTQSATSGLKESFLNSYRRARDTALSPSN
jgi:hypothetical protein